ncbi:MAG: MaoC/PaaZ C-terminal domain-containing protein [Acidimicrobiia bacterium]
MKATRSLTLTEALLRAYSRRGNFHSEPDEARRIGLPGRVAQGMQVAGPAYAIALDAWGDEFLGHGVIELKFVGMVTEDQTIDTTVEIVDDDATVTVTNRDTGAVAVVGSMRRSG